MKRREKMTRSEKEWVRDELAFVSRCVDSLVKESHVINDRVNKVYEKFNLFLDDDPFDDSPDQVARPVVVEEEVAHAVGSLRPDKAIRTPDGWVYPTSYPDAKSAIEACEAMKSLPVNLSLIPEGPVALVDPVKAAKEWAEKRASEYYPVINDPKIPVLPAFDGSPVVLKGQVPKNQLSIGIGYLGKVIHWDQIDCQIVFSSFETDRVDYKTLCANPIPVELAYWALQGGIPHYVAYDETRQVLWTAPIREIVKGELVDRFGLLTFHLPNESWSRIDNVSCVKQEKRRVYEYYNEGVLLLRNPHVGPEIVIRQARDED